MVQFSPATREARVRFPADANVLLFIFRERVHFGKIMCPGHEIPNDALVQEFQNSVHNYFYDYPDPSLVIGVHCTHGVNRTGYMIARYNISFFRIQIQTTIFTNLVN